MHKAASHHHNNNTKKHDGTKKLYTGAILPIRLSLFFVWLKKQQNTFSHTQEKRTTWTIQFKAAMRNGHEAAIAMYFAHKSCSNHIRSFRLFGRGGHIFCASSPTTSSIGIAVDSMATGQMLLCLQRIVPQIGKDLLLTWIGHDLLVDTCRLPKRSVDFSSTLRRINGSGRK